MSKKTKPFIYVGNFKDENWTLKNQKFVKFNIKTENEIELLFTKDLTASDIKNDNETKDILKFFNKDFDLLHNFEISFKIGRSKEEMIQSSFKKGIGIDFFISNFSYAKILFGLNHSTSFGFIMPEFKSDLPASKGSEYGSFFSNPNEYEYILAYLNLMPSKMKSNRLLSNDVLPEKIGNMENPLSTINISSKRDLMLAIKYNNSNRNFKKKIYKSLKKEKSNNIFFEYKIIHNNGKLIIEEYIPYNNTLIKFSTEPIDFKYMNENFLSFMLLAYPNVNEFNKSIIIKDFRIEQ